MSKRQNLDPGIMRVMGESVVERMGSCVMLPVTIGIFVSTKDLAINARVPGVNIPPQGKVWGLWDLREK